MKQKVKGENWISSYFNGSQLRVIYELFNDKFIDKYLDGEFQQKTKMIFIY